MNIEFTIEKSPLEHLLMLEDRVRHSGSTLPENVDERVQWSGIKCTLSGQNVIVRLDEVSEILDNPQITKIPKCKNWIKGVLNLRGRLLPVFDVSKYLKDESFSNNIEKVEVLVVEIGTLFCGIVTDKVFGMQRFYEDDFQDFNLSKESKTLVLSNYFETLTIIEKQQWHQLSLTLLAKALFEKDPYKDVLAV